MNINDFPGGSPERIHGGSSKINSTHARFESREVSQNSGLNSADRAQDPEVIGLVRQLAEISDVRPERIEEVKQKIQSNEFFSRQAAEATAEAFLR